MAHAAHCNLAAGFSSGVVAGCLGEGQLPPPKFWAIGKSSEFCGKIVIYLELKTPFWGDLGTKLKFCTLIISSVRNLWLSVGILLEICNVYWKIATSYPAYFFDP